MYITRVLCDSSSHLALAAYAKITIQRNDLAICK